MYKLLRWLVSDNYCSYRRRKTSRRAGPYGQHSSAEVLENRTLLAAQLIASDVATKTVTAGQTIDIPVTYQTLDDNDSPAALRATLVSVNLHFDSDVLTWDSTSSIFDEDISVIPRPARSEDDVSVIGDDNDTGDLTDSVLVTGYTDSPTPLAPENTGWPDAPVTTPLVLYVAHFTVKPGFSGSTRINFSANATGNVIGQAAEFSFSSNSVTLQTASVPATPTLNSVTQTTGDVRTPQSWDTVSGAVRYEVWFSRIAPGPSRLFKTASVVTTTSWTPPADLAPATYRSWVRSIGSDGQSSEWSASQTFDVRPTLIGPLTPTFAKKPTFHWNAIPNASGYQIFLRTKDPTIGNKGDIVVSDIPAGTTSWSPTSDLPDGRIHWWIRATDSIGNRGWSAVGRTNVDSRGSVTAAVAGNITWQAVTEAKRYILHVQNVDSGEVALREDNLTDTSFAPTTPLASGNYRAWIKAIDSTDRFSSGLWSRPFGFNVPEL